MRLRHENRYADVMNLIPSRESLQKAFLKLFTVFPMVGAVWFHKKEKNGFAASLAFISMGLFIMIYSLESPHRPPSTIKNQRLIASGMMLTGLFGAIVSLVITDVPAITLRPY